MAKPKLPAMGPPSVAWIDVFLDRKACQNSFAEFVKRAWSVLEPETPIVWNWHMQAMCDHLQALVDGTFLERGLSNRLLINVPPGSSKSLVVSVFLQAWEWGPAGRQARRYLSTAYNDEPVNRDTRKCRDLMLSQWYRDRWPDVQFVRQAETSFANSRMGSREGSAFGSLTSKRADVLIIDDPHSTETAESDKDRKRTTRKFREGALNRLNDQKRSAIIVIMQRLHEQDMTGVILDLKLPYVHLMLPMEFDPARKCVTPLGFEDPRTIPGEIMDPVRWPPDELAKLKQGMTSYSWAGQYDQRPVPREGGMFKREWFDNRIIRQAPRTVRWVRYWDLAGTEGENADRTAGVKLGILPDGRFVVGHVVKDQIEGAAVRRLITSTAQMDGRACKIGIPQDPGQAGKVQAQDYAAMLAGYVVKKVSESGEKATRAEPFAAQCEFGNVFIVQGEWNQDYLDELCLFPGGKFDDQVDASSGAFGLLQGKEAPRAVIGGYRKH